MSGVDGIGDVVTGAMAARAVEPAAGEGDGHTHEKSCLNCGTFLTGDYCHVCGQRAHVHRTLGAFVHDLTHGVLHFEGKTFRTLPMLAWKPGELTRRYIEGERARFVSPMALFLFSVFVMFALLGATVSSTAFDQPRISGDITRQIGIEQRELAQLETARKTVPGGEGAVALDAEIVEKKSDIENLRALEKIKVGDAAKLELSGDMEWLREPIAHALENPDLLLYKVRTGAYKWSWALIPLSLPFLWLLFPFSRRFGAYDHIVFITYSLSFMTLLVVASVLIGLAGFWGISGLALMIPPIHFYRQLKGAYALTRWGALWRAAALTIFATIALTLFGVLMFVMGVTG